MENCKIQKRSFKQWVKDEFTEYKVLLRSVPGLITAIYCVAVVMMNLMANKIIFSLSFAAADGGLLLSWIPFLCMDIVVKRFGPKAANKLNILALVINLVAVGFFALIAFVNPNPDSGAFDAVFSCNWFVLLGSSIAFVAAGFINNFLNFVVGKMFKKNPDDRLAYFTRSYVSTVVAQFADNFIFTAIVFMLFAPIYWGFGLTFVQCIGSSVIGALLEFVMEVVFSPVGYRISKNWEKNNVGQEYIQLQMSRGE